MESGAATGRDVDAAGGMKGVMGCCGSVGNVDSLVGVACGSGVCVGGGIVESPGKLTSRQPSLEIILAASRRRQVGVRYRCAKIWPDAEDPKTPVGEISKMAGEEVEMDIATAGPL